jgi:hypothetical protein
VQDNELLLDLGEISNNDCGPESLSAQYLELLSLVEEYELDEGNLLLYPIEIADRMVFVP